jgi:SWI/SNF-related matrix-associated actin-dependent regulator of chromatin subfamily A3
VEGVLTGEKGFYDCPIRITILGTPIALARTKLEERLKKDKLLTATR